MDVILLNENQMQAILDLNNKFLYSNSIPGTL